MRLVSIALVAAGFLIFSAPTCFVSVEKTERGTYVGSAANAGGETSHDGSVTGRLLLANGEALTPRRVPLCPSVLLPGERGAFETEDFVVPSDIPQEGLPVTVDFLPFGEGAPGFGEVRGDGLLVKEVSRAASARVVDVEVTNNSDATYRNLALCGVLYDGDRVSAVASSELSGFDLRPGVTIPAELAFTTMGTGRLRLYAFGETDTPPPPCCPATGGSTWKSVKNQNFSVLLPSGWAYKSAQGIDSFVGTYRGDGADLSFDYGMYSNNLPYDNGSAYDVHEETIGGFTAKIVRAKASGVTGVYFPFVDTFHFPGDDTAGFHVALTIEGKDLTHEQQQTALQIFRSIRFP